MMAMDYNFFNAQESGVDDGKYYINFKNPRLAQHSTLIKAFSAGFSLCGMLLEGE